MAPTCKPLPRLWFFAKRFSLDSCLPLQVRTKISVGPDVFPLGFLHAPSRSFRIKLIRKPKKVSVLPIARASEFLQILALPGNPDAQPPPPFFEFSAQISLTGRFAALLSSTVLLFVAQDTPRKLILQVLFLRSVLRTNHVVLALLRHSTLAPTAAGAVSSVFAAAVRRVLGVSRLNCLIL